MKPRTTSLHPLLILLAVALVSVLFVVSCGGGATATAVPGTGAAEAAAAEAEAAAAEAAAAEAAAAEAAAAEAAAIVEEGVWRTDRAHPPVTRIPPSRRWHRLVAPSTVAVSRWRYSLTT